MQVLFRPVSTHSSNT